MDFDYSSKCWRENKKSNKDGSFFYRCSYLYYNKKNCKKRCKENILNFDYKSTILDDNFDENMLCKKHIHQTQQIVKLNS